MDYLALMENGMKFEREWREETRSRLEYLSIHIFNFTTYDTQFDEEFAAKALEVAEVITNHTTFDYIKNEDNYRWYLLMVNMPFFADRLEWGTSIRGAWWDQRERVFQSCGLFDGNGQQWHTDIKLNAEEWDAFIKAVLEFGKKE